MAETVDLLLAQWRNGDSSAGERLIAIVYEELRRLAASYFRHESPGHTLQPTALVNEVFLKLTSGTPVQWADRTHFFAVAARQMRRLLIDHARRRMSMKRRADAQIELPEFLSTGNRGSHIENLLAVDEAMAGLEEFDSRAVQVVELRVFGGLSENEIAEALNISLATVKRDWTFAKAWLVKQLKS